MFGGLLKLSTKTVQSKTNNACDFESSCQLASSLAAIRVKCIVGHPFLVMLFAATGITAYADNMKCLHTPFFAGHFAAIIFSLWTVKAVAGGPD